MSVQKKSGVVGLASAGFLLASLMMLPNVCLAQYPLFPQFEDTTLRPLSPPSLPEILPKEKGGIQSTPGRNPTRKETLTEPEKEPTLSSFEEYIRGKSSLTLSTDIHLFGYELFDQPSDTFSPIAMVPVSPDYLLGPGDGIRISLWGKIQAEYSAVLDRDGKISLPLLGVMHLAGMSFSEVKQFLAMELSRSYKASEVRMNVSMGRLRSIKVYLVGNIEHPGSYTLSSLSTLTNALFASGGPSKIGSLRDIQVKRKGETIVHFDLYDFLMKGEKSGDIRLMPEDVIFIPPIGQLAGIAGHVNHPAIYELNKKTRVSDLIKMAGGLNPLAFKGRIQVQRIEDHALRTFFETNLIGMEDGSEKDFFLKNGDLVKVFSILQTTDWKRFRTVQIIGEVQSPGEYIVEKGDTLSALIEHAGGFREGAYLKGAVFTRRSVKALQKIRLDESIDRLEHQLLSQSARMIETAISPQSAQQQEAASEHRQSLIAKLRTAEPKGRITIQLDRLEKFKKTPMDIILEDGDVLIIPEKPQQIQVIGAVYNQTAFVYEPNAPLKGYLKKAGGMTQDANKDELYVLKVDGTAVSKREYNRGFGRGLLSSTVDPGDTIVVPEKFDKIAWLREFKDISQILYQIAVTAGVLIVVF